MRILNTWRTVGSALNRTQKDEVAATESDSIAGSTLRSADESPRRKPLNAVIAFGVAWGAPVESLYYDAALTDPI